MENARESGSGAQIVIVDDVDANLMILEKNAFAQQMRNCFLFPFHCPDVWCRASIQLIVW